MSYLRTNGRFTGRVSGRWGRASVEGGYELGDISDMGTGTEIAGDPVMALLAQLNRFAGKTLDPGFGCKTRRYVTAAFPLVPGELSDAAATAAVIILYDRYNCVALSLIDRSPSAMATKATAALSPGAAVPFVMQNITEVTVTIAQFGDKLGLAPAAYGITTKAPMFTPSSKIPTPLLIGGGVLVLALLLGRRKK